MSYTPRVALASGTRLGPYEVLSPLGAGGMGEVYRAHDSRLGRDVALKLLPEALASSPERLARLEREARMIAGLNHPNIVVLYSIEEAAGTRFLTMELVEGRDLSTMIAPGGLPLAQVLDLAIPLADALAAAHERRVVHRDLKPANVMLTRNGHIKVLDFGLAKLTEIESGLDSTRSMTTVLPASDVGGVSGTAPYMAPEQVRGEAADARADIFSLGILVYELATGRRPFVGRSSSDVKSAILNDSAPSLTSVRSDLPSDLGRILGRCLEKNPRERFQTALDVANELRGLKRTLRRGAPEPAKPSSGKVASIAVLPFANRSASADDEYFSDGLADELLNVLAKVRGLHVAARTSAFQFKGRNEDIATIGQKLNVATLLEGSVRKAGDRVRISVQLVKVADGYQMWSETYDRKVEDIFAVQDDIARSVVKELRTTLLGEESDSKASGEVRAEIAQATMGKGTDPEAHRLYLYARYLSGRSTREETKKAIEYLNEALARDPEFALAWVMLGVARTKQAALGWAPVAESWKQAREAVERALALSPDLAQAHSLLGHIRMVHDYDWRGAEAASKRALELGPGEAAVLRRSAQLTFNLGRLEESFDLSLRALQLDPLSAVAHFNLGLVLGAQDRWSDAEEALRRSLEIAPQRFGAHAWLSLVLLAQGRGEEALAEAEREVEEALRLWAVAVVHHGLGHAAESRDALDNLIEQFAASAAYQIAQIYAVRGDKDAAFEWLDRAYEQGDTGLGEIKTSALLLSLHADARWNALSKKLGFED